MNAGVVMNASTAPASRVMARRFFAQSGNYRHKIRHTHCRHRSFLQTNSSGTVSYQYTSAFSITNNQAIKSRCLSSSAAAATTDPSLCSDTVDAIRIADFSYDLCIESIAKYPAYPRGSSRLLRVDADGKASYYDNFTESFPILADGSHIVFNESKVVNGRLNVTAEGDNQNKKLEMMILDMGDTGTDVDCIGVDLKVMIRRVGVEVGTTFVEARKGMGTFEVVHVQGLWEEDEHSNGNGTECTVRCIAHDDSIKTIGDMLDAVGMVPIPPYLDREAEEADEEAYNNVYAADGGSVAAPTAGLHFTDQLLRDIGDESLSFLSLHVGAGTFKPVIVENARDHQMHAETFQVSVGEVRRIISALESGKPLIVVGTTSCRTLESLYWCGVKRIAGLDGGSDNLSLDQEEWIPLLADKEKSGASAAESLSELIKCKGDDDYLRGSTSLMIIPKKYEFKVVENLITNFHAPDSTLMLLVSAFLGSGDKVRAVYEEAQERGYKFLSYGDVCMFSRPNKSQ
mmetsp:Transcript_14909/g.30005  ORF Transcript_14909/g.30005 Transcript_14909/m.30005 type:complete len:514 (-) Transcript_14909:1815-3356(-)